jgi:hypothetical protein
MMPGYAPSAKKRHQKRKIAAPFQRSSAQRMAKSACVPTTGGNPARGNRLAAVPLDRIELPAGLGRGGCRLRRRRSLLRKTAFTDQHAQDLYAQFGALDRVAQVLIEKTRAEAS